MYHIENIFMKNIFQNLDGIILLVYYVTKTLTLRVDLCRLKKNIEREIIMKVKIINQQMEDRKL